MKKLLFLLILIPFLFGCEPMYMEPSNPQLNLNGSHKIIQIIPDWSQEVLVMNNSSYTQAPYSIDSIGINGRILAKSGAPMSACFFYKLGYVWEFDYNNLILKDNMGKIIHEYRIASYGQVFYNPYDFQLFDKNTEQPIPGIWHIMPLVKPSGSMPSRDIAITVPPLYFSFESSLRSFDRFVYQGITIILTTGN